MISDNSLKLLQLELEAINIQKDRIFEKINKHKNNIKNFNDAIIASLDSFIFTEELDTNHLIKELSKDYYTLALREDRLTLMIELEVKYRSSPLTIPDYII